MGDSERRSEVRSCIRRAEEFLSLAKLATDDPSFANAVVSLCVTAGIAASDAVLIAAGKSRHARDEHDQAPADLRRLGQDPLAQALARLLRLKSKAQYTVGEACSLTDSRLALRNAERALELALGFIGGT